jgi:MFS transporter, DHA3 family, macrolide efflux protein
MKIHPPSRRPISSLHSPVHLFRTRSFAFLFIGEAVNGIGSWTALIGLWGFAAYRFHSGAGEIALLALCWSAPAALLGPLTGLPIDRLDPKRVLVVAYLASAMAATAMAFAGSLTQLAVLATLYGVCKAFSTPAADALPPRIVAPDDLLAANALLGAAQESAIVFGPLVAAVAIAVGGLQAAFVIDAATYLVGVAVVAPLALSAVVSPPRPRLRTELTEGLSLARQTPVLRYVLTLSSAVFLTWAAFVIVEPLYARDVLHRPASQFALFQVAFGTGLILTSLVLPRLGARVAGARSLAIAVLLSGLTAAAYVGTHDVRMAYLGVFGWGVDVAFFAAPSRTVLQRAAPAHAHGRILSLYRTSHSVADVLAIPLTGLFVGIVGVQVAGLSMAAFASLAGIIGLVQAPSFEPSSPQPGRDLLPEPAHL